MLPSQFSKVDQNVFQSTDHKFLLCAVHMNILKLGFIYDWFVVTIDNFDEQNCVIKSNNTTPNIIQIIYADNFFGPSNAKRSSLTLVEEVRRRSDLSKCY